MAAQWLQFWRGGSDNETPRRRRPPVKPSELIYGVEESPPSLILWAAGLQHVLVSITVGLAFPLLVLDAAQAPLETVQHVVSASMLALGLGTLLFCLNSRDIGSGYLMPASFSGVYLTVSIAAAKQGGLPLVAGMTIFAGLVQVLLSRFVHRLRPYLPTEIAGLAMLMSGLTLAVIGFNLMTGVSAAADTLSVNMEVPTLLGVGLVLLMIALHVWGSTGVKLYIVLIGLAVGYVVAIALGFVRFSEIRFSPTNIVHAPIAAVVWPTMAGNLVVPFAVAAVAASLRAIGDLTTVQKMNDTRWLRPDMLAIGRGLTANGVGMVIAGCLGTVGTGTTSGSVGVSVATGVTSRVVGYATGMIFLAVAFFPTLHDLFITLPHPVMGAAFVFTSCFIIVSGMQVMVSRLMDGRRTLVIGVGLLLGFSRYLFPGFYAAAPHYLQPVVSGPLIIALVGALLLNLVFRIGVKKSASIDFTPGGDPLTKLEQFAQRQGGVWGARRDVIERVERAMIEAAECLELLVAARRTARVTMKFDEYWLDVLIDYEGKPLIASAAAPTHDELLADESQLTRLGAILIRRQATRLNVGASGGMQRISLGFEH
jgi:NCS2 family nucleobase:cation symporter-2